MRPESIANVAISDIDWADETFSVNFMPDLSRLRSSIEAVGLLQPVVLRRKGNAYQTVRGFRRLAALRALERTDVPATICHEDADERVLFLEALHENLLTRDLNAVEKALALDHLVNRFGMEPQRVVREILPLFDLETNGKILSTFLALARMENEVREFVVREKVSRNNIRKLAALSAEERLDLVAFISPLKLGENTMRELLTLFEEIGRRERSPIREIAERPEVREILLHPELTPSQKTEKLKKALTALRYPGLQRQEAEFESSRRELELPTGISVRPSPFFEGKELRIDFQFSSEEDYRKALSTLSALPGKPAFRALLEEKKKVTEE
jgi:ParB/RepB/Spo0J family partition protein